MVGNYTSHNPAGGSDSKPSIEERVLHLEHRHVLLVHRGAMCASGRRLLMDVCVVLGSRGSVPWRCVLGLEGGVCRSYCPFFFFFFSFFG